MSENNLELQLIDAGEKLGQAMAKVGEEEKKILREMKSQVDLFVTEEEAKGKYLDRSAFFAAGIIAHPDLTTEELIDAAKNYIDYDYMFVKALAQK